MEITQKEFTLTMTFLVVMIILASYFLIINIKNVLDKEHNLSQEEKCIRLYFSQIKTEGKGFEPSCEELLFINEDIDCSQTENPDKCYFILAEKDNFKCSMIKDISLTEECISKYKISSEKEQ